MHRHYDQVSRNPPAAGPGLLGSVATGIATDPAGDVYVTGVAPSPDFTVSHTFQAENHGGADAFVGSRIPPATCRLRPAGGRLPDAPRSVTLDSTGNAYLTGVTTNARLPIVDGTQPYLGGEVFLVSADGGSHLPKRNAPSLGSRRNLGSRFTRDPVRRRDF